MRALRNKVAVVAGAAPGNIGGATAIRLAQEGMKVVAADLNAAAAQVVVDEITSAGGYAVAKEFDITDEAAYNELIESPPGNWGDWMRSSMSPPICRRGRSAEIPTSARCPSMCGSARLTSPSPGTCMGSGMRCRS